MIEARIRRLLLCVPLLAGLALSARAQSSAEACPPALQPPSAEQLQAAQRMARDRGALWRVTRDGRTSYLFGTIHVGTLAWAMPGPRLRAALQATDTVALEIDPTDPQIAARMNAAPAAGVPSTLPPALAERLSRRLERGCVPPEVRPLIDAQHPVMQAITLTVLEARRAGLEVAYGQEIVLAGFGRAAQRRIVSLETPESQLAALMPRSAPELQAMVTSMLDQLEQGASQRALGRLAAAWERGDIDELGRYEQWCECVLVEADRALLKRLLDDRNPALAERIDALHREGRKVFAGVGALHMVGPQGLPALLRTRGFRVERVAD